MSDRVVGGIDGHGRAVARKRASDPAQRASLAWEAAALAAARHPGVVELLEVDAGSLSTVYAGTHSLATCPPLGIERITATGAGLAATVAELHSLGIVHGRLDPSHVIVGPGGRPLLCGLSGATVAGRIGPPTSTAVDGCADPRLPTSGPTPPAADVYSIGAVLRFLLLRGGGRRRPHAGRRRSLESIIRRAMAAEPHRRPTARALAAELSRSPRRPRPGVARLTAAAGVGLAAVGVGAGLVVAAADRGEPTATAANRTRASTTTSIATATTTGPVPDVVGPNLVAVGNDRFRAGAPGDQVVIGDWDCDGAATVALLRVPTGEVFVFDAWATSGHDLTIRPRSTVAGAVRASARDPDGDGCATLVVEQSGGEFVEVEP